MSVGHFGTTPDGTSVQRITLSNGELTAAILTRGALLQDLRLDGHPYPLVLGYPDLPPYVQNPYYFGATIGRFANRLRNGIAMIDGTRHQLDRNTPQGHHIHGGREGTTHANWQIVDHSETATLLATRLPDGHMGFPGTLDVTVGFQLCAGPTLEIEITARTDAPTLCSFAHHSYFNLDGTATIDRHRLIVNATKYLPTDPDGLPTGDVRDVAGTAFDFRLGRTLLSDHPHDHNLCLATQRQPLSEAATLIGETGLQMRMITTEPGLQIYTGDGIAADTPGLLNMSYGPRSGVALEPQLWPDAPNHPAFPSATLFPGEAYRQVTQLSFD